MSKSKNMYSMLAQFLKKNPKSGPVAGLDYYERFRRIDEYLNERVHPFVNEGAAVAAQASGGSAGWLTAHGADHVSTVIQRASELCSATPRGAVVTPYEAYLLLLAIHFHDVGNIFGRDEHEKRVKEVFSGLGDALLGDDTIEKRMILNVAMAHGGSINGNKDTIATALSAYDLRPLHGPRPHLLAAILRFADELADDYSRASRFALDTPGGKKLLRGSEAYHMYADRLRRVEINSAEGTVALRFELLADHAIQPLRKGSRKVLLFDEIRERLLKLYKEFTYCRRYLLPYIHIERIESTLEIFRDSFTSYTPIFRDKFIMQESGYPPYPTDLNQVSPSWKTTAGVEKTGRWLKIQVQTALAAPETT